MQVQAAANAQLWDDKDGAFFDNPSTFLHPQDGNALAVRAIICLQLACSLM